jgi:DNA-binding response OmpR family regulator
MYDNRLRILLVEDNEGDSVLVEEYIAEAGRGEFIMARARTLAQGQRLLVDFRPQVLLLDLNLPDSKGIDTLDHFCTVTMPPDLPRPPIIVLTSLDDADAADRAVSSCAQDYLVKNDVNAKVLLRSIRFAIQRHGKDKVDKMLEDPDKSDGNQQEALSILQRINRTAPGEVRDANAARTMDEPQTSDGLLLQHFATGSKASEVIFQGLDQRISRLERVKHERDVVDARREMLLTQMEKLLVGNGRGPLVARLETMERTMSTVGWPVPQRLHAPSWTAVGCFLLAVGWAASLVAWFVFGLPRVP